MSFFGGPTVFPLLMTDLSREYHNMREKHGEHAIDGKECTQINRLAALIEECGEVANALTYDGAPKANLRAELLQVANVALAWASILPPDGPSDAPFPKGWGKVET